MAGPGIWLVLFHYGRNEPSTIPHRQRFSGLEDFLTGQSLTPEHAGPACGEEGSVKAWSVLVGCIILSATIAQTWRYEMIPSRETQFYMAAFDRWQGRLCAIPKVDGMPIVSLEKAEDAEAQLHRKFPSAWATPGK